MSLVETIKKGFDKLFPWEPWMLEATSACVDGRHDICSGTARDFFTLTNPWYCTCPCHGGTDIKRRYLRDG